MHGVHDGAIRILNADGVVGDLFVADWHVDSEKVCSATGIHYGHSGGGVGGPAEFTSKVWSQEWLIRSLVGRGVLVVVMQTAGFPHPHRAATSVTLARGCMVC